MFTRRRFVQAAGASILTPAALAIGPVNHGSRLRTQSAGGGGDLEDLPLVQESDISYLGFFNLPQFAGGTGDAFTMHYGGGGLGIGPDNTIYVAGHLHHGKLARFNIPDIGDTATVVTNLTTVPGSFSDVQNTIGGSLVWNDRLIVSKFGNYENPGEFNNSHTSCALNLTGFTTPQKTSFQRMAAGFMGVIPPAHRDRFGGPCFMGSGPRSIDNNECSLGPAFFVFDPEQVDGSGDLDAENLCSYPLAQAQRIQSGANFYETNGVGGAGWIPGTRTILFAGHIGAGSPDYMQPITGDPCRNGNSGFTDYPYRLAFWPYDALDFLAVKEDADPVWTPLPYGGGTYRSWTPPGYGSPAACFGIGSFNTSTACFDPDTNRLYMCEEFGEQPRVHVWEIDA
jgi:hypothetical protein